MQVPIRGTLWRIGPKWHNRARKSSLAIPRTEFIGAAGSGVETRLAASLAAPDFFVCGAAEAPGKVTSLHMVLVKYLAAREE
jgi:hypothetical protein